MKKKISYYIGIDIGGTKIAAAVVKDDGTILSREKIPTPRGASDIKIYQVLLQLIKRILKASGIELAEIGGIGIGVPGIIDSTGEKILATPNIQLAGFPLYQYLQRDLNIPVALGNDVNVGLLGEKWLGRARKVDNIVGLFPGTGIGGAIIINGRLYAGSFGGAGELGHMIIQKDGPLCSCKNHGCLEALASRWAIERDLKAAIKKGRRTSLMLGAQIKSKELKQALQLGDKLVCSVMEKASDALGQACISLRHIFDPQMIILGGGIIEACGDFMISRIKKAVDADPFFAHLPSCDIVASQLGDEAVILGAVALLKDNLIFQAPKQKGVNFPHFQFKKHNQVWMDEAPLKENIYVRSDGTWRKMNNKPEFEELRRSHVISADAVKRLCKKGTSFLVIGTHSSHLDLTEDAKQFLIKKSIKAQILPVKESISVYNALPQQKVFLLHLK